MPPEKTAMITLEAIHEIRLAFFFNHLNFLHTGGNIMGKYLVLWKIEQSTIPINPKKRGEGWTLLMALIRQDMKKGLTKDWGVFVGERNGYAINEGTELEVMNGLQQYVPFCSFKVHPIATPDMAEEMIKTLSG